MVISHDFAHRIGLGTVQFGLDYGISNGSGVVSPAEVSKILIYARENGVKVIDTAAAYGESEKVLGKTLPRRHGFKIVTKVPAAVASHSHPHQNDIAKTFLRSLDLLKQPVLDTLMLHQANDLLTEDGPSIYEEMAALKKSGLVRRLGVSIYERDQIDSIFSKFSFDVAQLPINVFDQRLLQDGTLAHLKSLGVEIHARSVFLQGLILMKTSEIPDHLEALRPYHSKLKNLVEKNGMTSISAALSFVLNIKEIDVVLVGVTSLAQLKEVLNTPTTTNIGFSEFNVTAKELIDPRLWPK